MTLSFADREAAIRAEVEAYCWRHDDYVRVVRNDDSPTDYLPRPGAYGAGLIWSVDNGYRGELATWLYYRYRLGLCAQSLYREALNAAWVHDHNTVCWYISRNRWLLKAMFRHAGFPVPAELPDRVDIWRGARGEALEAYGPSWTTDRDVACWFACNWGPAHKSPVVLKLTAPKAELTFLFNDRNESDVVYFGPRGSAVVDGDLTDWLAGAKRRTSRARVAA